MVCPDVKATAAYVNKVGTACVASKTTGQKEIDEYCSPVINPPSEAVEGINASADSFRGLGRPMFCGKKRLSAPQKQPG
jgi:hypothetical protein